MPPLFFYNEAMEKEIKEKSYYQNKPFFDYSRPKGKKNELKIKEWDYYEIVSDDDTFVINITFSRLGLSTLVSLSYVDRINNKSSIAKAFKVIAKNRTLLAENSEQEYYATFANEDLTVSVVKKGIKAQIIANAPALPLQDGKKGILLDIVIYDEAEESINTYKSDEEGKKVFFNEKRGPLKCEGTIRRDLEIKPLKGCALINRLRGLFFRESVRLWGAIVDEDYMLCLSKDDENANAIVHGGKAFKLENVNFTVPQIKEKEEWIIKDQEGRLSLTFSPLLQNNSDGRSRLISYRRNQIFGLFNGYVKIEEKEIEIKNKFAFLEESKIRW